MIYRFALDHRPESQLYEYRHFGPIRAAKCSYDIIYGLQCFRYHKVKRIG